MRLPTIAGADLPPIGWQHEEPFDPDRIRPVSNADPRAMPGQPGWGLPMKPLGGLWTAPMCAGGTRWAECLADMGRDATAPTTVMFPDPDSRVYAIDTVSDLVQLEASYHDPDAAVEETRVWPLIDWSTLARDVDAVWLTEAGQEATRYSMPGLYGWDCETVLWLQPRVRAGAVVTVDGSAGGSRGVDLRRRGGRAVPQAPRR